MLVHLRLSISTIFWPTKSHLVMDCLRWPQKLERSAHHWSVVKEAASRVSLLFSAWFQFHSQKLQRSLVEYPRSTNIPTRSGEIANQAQFVAIRQAGRIMECEFKRRIDLMSTLCIPHSTYSLRSKEPTATSVDLSNECTFHITCFWYLWFISSLLTDFRP